MLNNTGLESGEKAFKCCSNLSAIAVLQWLEQREAGCTGALGSSLGWGAAPLPMDAGGNTAAVAAGHAGLGWLLLCSLKGCKSLAQRCRTISPRRLEQRGC